MSPESVASSHWWERRNLTVRAISAFKAGLAAVLCLFLGNLFGLVHSYWAAVSAIVVMSSDSNLNITTCRDRITGTAIGAFLGWATYYAWHGHYLLYGLAVMLCVFVCSLLEFEKAGRLAAVTLTIIVLISIDGGPAKAALARFLEVAFGIVVAYAVTMLVFPPHPEKTEVKVPV